MGIFFEDRELWEKVSEASKRIEPVFLSWDFSSADAFDGGVTTPNYLPGIYVSRDHGFAWRTINLAASRFPDLLVIWIDAHGDVKERGEEREVVARKLVGRGVEIVWMGVRAVDPYEKEFLKHFSHFSRLIPISTSRPVWISLDIDVFDPAFAPAVVWPEPGGIAPREFFEWLENSDFKLVGADVTEYQPEIDNGKTSLLVARLVEVLATLSSP